MKKAFSTSLISLLVAVGAWGQATKSRSGDPAPLVEADRKFLAALEQQGGQPLLPEIAAPETPSAALEQPRVPPTPAPAAPKRSLVAAEPPRVISKQSTVPADKARVALEPPRLTIERSAAAQVARPAPAPVAEQRAKVSARQQSVVEARSLKKKVVQEIPAVFPTKVRVQRSVEPTVRRAIPVAGHREVVAITGKRGVHATPRRVDTPSWSRRTVTITNTTPIRADRDDDDDEDEDDQEEDDD